MAFKLHVDPYTLNFTDFAEVKFLNDELTKTLGQIDKAMRAGAASSGKRHVR